MRSCGLALVLMGCAARTPPLPAMPTPPLVPLERVCQEALPVATRSVGDLGRLLRRLDWKVALESRPCDVSSSWPIAFVEAGADRPPIGITLLRMEGDALLTLDPRQPDAPVVKLCAELEFRLADHRVRAVALWDSNDEAAFSPDRIEASTAELAWVELLSRRPSACALGQREAAGQLGDPALAERLRCMPPAFVAPLAEGCGDEPRPPAPVPSVDDEALARSHRFTFPGRTAVRPGDLELLRPERCAYEPPPASHDVCVAEYARVGHPEERWFGRSDVTRTGAQGEKNYVDSYLTLQLLKRLEAERRAEQQHRQPKR